MSSMGSPSVSTISSEIDYLEQAGSSVLSFSPCDVAPGEFRHWGNEVYEVLSAGESVGAFLICYRGVAMALAVRKGVKYVIIPRESGRLTLDTKDIMKVLERLVVEAIDEIRSGVRVRLNLLSLADFAGSPLDGDDQRTRVVVPGFNENADLLTEASENDGFGKAGWRAWMGRVFDESFGGRRATDFPEDARGVFLFPGLNSQEVDLWRSKGFKISDMVMLEGDGDRARRLREKYPEAFVIAATFQKDISSILAALYRWQETSPEGIDKRRLRVISIDPENRLSQTFFSALRRFCYKSPWASLQDRELLLFINFLIKGRQNDIAKDLALLRKRYPHLDEKALLKGGPDALRRRLIDEFLSYWPEEGNISVCTRIGSLSYEGDTGNTEMHSAAFRFTSDKFKR